MSRPLAAILAAVAIAASGCNYLATLAAPQPGFRPTLVDALKHGTTVPLPANVAVVSLIYSVPAGTSVDSPLTVLPVRDGKLPRWTTSPGVTGTQVIGMSGLYVGVFAFDATPTIHYLARVADPRDVRGEHFDPAGSAVLVKASRGTYAARVPFLPGKIAVGFEVDGSTQTVSLVHFYLPFGSTPPSVRGLKFKAVHD